MEDTKIVKKLKDLVVNPSDRYFLFSDASLRPTYGSSKRKVTHIIGMGAELRDSNARKVLFYSENKCLRRGDVVDKNPEFMALENALDIVFEQGVRNITVQTDLNSLAPKLNEYFEAHLVGDEAKKQSVLASSREFWLDLFKKVERFDDFFIEYIPREQNSNADLLSRSAEDLVNQERMIKKAARRLEDIKLKEKESVLLANVLKKKLTPKLIEEGDESIALSFSNKINHYMKFKDLYSKVSQFYKISDILKEKCFSIEIVEHYEKKTFDKPCYYMANKVYYGENKALALLFILMALESDKSNVEIVQIMHKLSVKKVLKYEHSWWNTFSDISDMTPYVGRKKKYFYMSYEIEKFIKSFLSKIELSDMSDNEIKSFNCVMKTYKNVVEITSIHALELFRVLTKTKDGEILDLKSVDALLERKLKRESTKDGKEESLKNEHPINVKVEKNTFMKNETAPQLKNYGFSFLDYGLKINAQAVL